MKNKKLIVIFYSAGAFFFLFFLHGFSIGNGKQGISYNGWRYGLVSPTTSLSNYNKTL